MQQLLFYW